VVILRFHALSVLEPIAKRNSAAGGGRFLCKVHGAVRRSFMK